MNRRGHVRFPEARRKPIAGTLACAATLALTVSFGFGQTSSGNAQDLLMQAAPLEQKHDYAGAEKLYRQAARAAPGDPEVLKRLGIVCQIELKYDDSIAAFQQILTRAPRYPDVNRLLGISYYGLNRFGDAERALDEELVANPKDRAARYYLALDLSALGRQPEAIRQLEALVAADPKDAASLYQLTVYYKAAAEETARRLNQLDPDSEWTHALRAQVLMDDSRPDDAIREYNEVLRKNHNFPGIHFGLGQAYWTKKDSEHAGEQLKLALQEDPEQPLANYYLADILTDDKQFPEAIPHLQIVIAAYPQMSRAYFLLGKCYQGAGSVQESLKAFNKSVEIDPNSKDAHYQLYQLYARLGDKEESQKHFARFQQLTQEGQEKDKTLLEKMHQGSGESKNAQ